jgi:CheY-like chemotaxis protein
MSEPLRVVIGEDDVLLREGIARLLTEAGFDVVAQAGDAEDLLRKGLAHRPSVVIADVTMPPGHGDDGLRAAIELRRQRPETGVLVLSQYVSGIFGALSVMAANSWMNQPGGFTLKAGRVVTMDPLKVFFNRAAAYEMPHMLLAAVIRQIVVPASVLFGFEPVLGPVVLDAGGGRSRAAGVVSASGSVTSNVAPLPGVDRTVTVPWWACTIAATIASPSPVPGLRGAAS